MGFGFSSLAIGIISINLNLQNILPKAKEAGKEKDSKVVMAAAAIAFAEKNFAECEKILSASDSVEAISSLGIAKWLNEA